MRRSIIAIALGLLPMTEAPGQMRSGFEPEQLPVRDGRVSLSARDDVMSLGAELAVRGSEERPKVLPELKSALTLGRMFGIEARVGLPDLNGEIGTGRTTVDTKLRLRPDIPLIRGVDTRIRRSHGGTITDTAVDFELPVAFVKQLEGRFRETPNGASTYSFTLGLPGADWAGDGGNGRFSSQAVLEQTDRPGHDESHRLGFETVLAGSRDSAGGGPLGRGMEAYKLVLGLEQRYVGAMETTAASLALNQSWLIRSAATLDLRMKLSHNGTATRKSLEVAWQAAF